MPDTSAVTVTIYPDTDLDGYTVQALVEYLDEVPQDNGWGWTVDDLWHDRDGSIQLQSFDLPWGMSTADETILKRLRALQVPYLATDSGGLEWPATTSPWAPGNDPYEILLDTNTGDPVFDVHTLDAIGMDRAREIDAEVADPTTAIDWEAASVGATG